jgi:major membrane immunogen (membrane-anchored lipoprotein)
MEDLMKRSIALALVLLVGLAGLAFGQIKAKDGVYFAQESAFAKESGWKDQAIVTVKGGKIVSLAWNGVSNTGIADKATAVAQGAYPMVKFGKAKAEWDVQSKAVVDFIVKTQNVGFSKFDAEGRTDAISGATIHVQGFFALVNAALASAPVPKGIYKKDGWYFAQQPDFDKTTTWKDSILLTVVNGTIVDVIWNGTSSDAKKKSKLVEDLAGRYGMEKAAKKGAWNVQAAAVQNAILKVQDPAKIALKPDTTTDAISGASLHATGVVLAVEALKAAR